MTDSKQFPVVDFHCDTLLRSFRKLSLADGNPEGQLDFPRLRQGGVKLQVMALWAVDKRYLPARVAWQTLRLIDEFHRQLGTSERVQQVKNRQDLKQVLGSDKTGLMLSIEGGDSLEGDLGLLRMYYRLGVRAITLTWSHRNDIGDGIEETSGSGLTRFGREVVAEMERLRMIVDVSHLNEAGFWDVAAMAKRPFIASHSNALALCKNTRNLNDEQIRAVAKSGGVIGINFFTGFLDDSEQASLQDIVRHIVHIASVAGWHHVGLGSDFDGITKVPEGLEDPGKFPRLIEALAAEGMSDDQIAGVMGGNFLRLLWDSLPDV